MNATPKTSLKPNPDAKWTKGPWLIDGDEVGFEFMIGGDEHFVAVAECPIPSHYNNVRRHHGVRGK